MNSRAVETDRHARSLHAGEAGQRIELHELLLSLGAIRLNALAPAPSDGDDKGGATPPEIANPGD